MSFRKENLASFLCSLGYRARLQRTEHNGSDHGL